MPHACIRVYTHMTAVLYPTAKVLSDCIAMAYGPHSGCQSGEAEPHIVRSYLRVLYGLRSLATFTRVVVVLSWSRPELRESWLASTGSTYANGRTALVAWRVVRPHLTARRLGKPASETGC